MSEVIRRWVQSAIEFNQATLSGAIDVVVLQDAQGNPVCSTPFHVQFGKLLLLRSSQRKVHLEVNGKELDVSMRLNRRGRAMFEVPPEEALSPFATDLELGTAMDTNKENDAKNDEAALEADVLKDTETETMKGTEHVHAEEEASATAPEQAPEEEDRSLMQLSLCRSLLTNDDPVKDAAIFAEHRVSWEEYESDPDLLHKSEAVMRVPSKTTEGEWEMYPARVAVHLLASQLLFNRSPDHDALDAYRYKVETRLLERRKEAPRGGWFSWLRSRPQPETSVSGSARTSPVPPRSPSRASQRSHAPSRSVDLSPESTRPPPLELPKRKEKDSAGIVSDIESTVASEDRYTHTPPASILRKLNLQPGRNSIVYTVYSTLQGVQTVEAAVFLWEHDARIIISDVDGTITRSDVLGQMLPLVGNDWAHPGVSELFSRVDRNGYRVLYLSSRAIAQSSITREYIDNVRQGEYHLPDGPILLCPDSLIEAFRREVIERRPHEFKIPALMGVKNLFTPSHNPFYAAFGNRDTDVLSYCEVGVPRTRIFTIDPKHRVRQCALKAIDTSYSSLVDLVDGMFPPLQRREQETRATAESFNDFNFWRETRNFDLEDLSDLDKLEDDSLDEETVNDKDSANDSDIEGTNNGADDTAKRKGELDDDASDGWGSMEIAASTEQSSLVEQTEASDTDTPRSC